MPRFRNIKYYLDDKCCLKLNVYDTYIHLTGVLYVYYTFKCNSIQILKMTDTSIYMYFLFRICPVVFFSISNLSRALQNNKKQFCIFNYCTPSLLFSRYCLFSLFSLITVWLISKKRAVGRRSVNRISDT